MEWQQILAQTAVQSVLLASVAWLTKTLLSQQFAKDLEIFRRRLAVVAEQDRIRFGRLHERRAEVIEEVYKRIVRVHATLGLQGEHSTAAKETALDLDAEVVEAAYYFSQHALYFTDDVRAKFHKVFVTGLPKPLLMLHGIGELEQLEVKIKERFGDAHGYDFRGPFLEHLKENMPLLQMLIRELEGEFQNILGVPSTGGRNGN